MDMYKAIQNSPQGDGTAARQAPPSRSDGALPPPYEVFGEGGDVESMLGGQQSEMNQGAPDYEPDEGEGEEVQTDAGGEPSPSASQDEPRPLRLKDGKELTPDQVEEVWLASQNREVFEAKAQEQRQEIERAVSWVREQSTAIQREREQIERERAENEAYRAHLMSQGVEIDDPIAKSFTAANPGYGQRRPQQQQQNAQYLTRDDLQRLRQDWRKQDQIEHVEANFEDWVRAEVESTPALSSMADVYRDHVATQIFRQFHSRGVDPRTLSEGQLRGVIREHTRRAASNLTKRDDAGQAERIEDHVRRGKELPPTPRALGTPAPKKPDAFRFDMKESWRKHRGDSDSFIDEWMQNLQARQSEIDRLSGGR